jgi:putative ABC transport system permease protein
MVDFAEVSMVALRALRRNLMRSILTALGIIIGVAAVIAMLAVGKGAENSVQQQIASMGSNMLIVMPGSTTQGGVRSGWGGSSRLNEADLDAIRTECSAVGLAAPNVRTVSQVVSPTQNWSTAIIGTTPEYKTIRNWTLASGDWFSDTDVTSAAAVCVLGKTTADQLFGSDDPIGQTVRIKKIPFRVVGTLASKGQSAMGDDQDDTVIAPFTTVQKKIMGSTHLGVILLQATSSDDTARAQSQVTSLLRQRHRIMPGQDDDFTVRNLADFAAAASAASSVFTMLLGSIASISLVVGGIGIMNIMLVSVTERTREIGIRRSLGARARDIMTQFLVESIVLSLLGGMAGILLGIVASKIVTQLAQWETAVAPENVLLAFGFAAAIGLLFGLYPARRAARLNPIDALRHE